MESELAFGAMLKKRHISGFVTFLRIAERSLH
jgi:hypothetical protein